MSDFFTLMNNYHQMYPLLAPIALGIALGIIGLLTLSWKGKTRVALWALSLLWAFDGLFLFTYYYGNINPTTYFLTGILFPLQAVLFLFAGNGEVDFGFSKRFASRLGMFFMFFALFLYPIIGNFTGHAYPAAPVFPEPCPLTIFTLGFLLQIRGRLPLRLIWVPLFWALMGLYAAFVMGVFADLAETIAGITAFVVILVQNKTHIRS